MNTSIKEFIIEGVKIGEFSNSCHVSFEKYHVQTYSAKLECEGNPIHGMVVIKQTKTRRYGFGKWGNPVTIYFLSYPKSKPFKTLEELIKHYNEVSR